MVDTRIASATSRTVRSRCSSSTVSPLVAGKYSPTTIDNIPHQAEALGNTFNTGSAPARDHTAFRTSGRAAVGVSRPRPRYQSTIGSPKSTKVIVPAARNGPNGMCCLRPRLTNAISSMPITAAVQEAGEQAAQDLGPAQPAEEQAEHEREPHVAEAHPPR